MNRIVFDKSLNSLLYVGRSDLVLAPEEQRIVTVTWDTTDYAPGGYWVEQVLADGEERADARTYIFVYPTPIAADFTGAPLSGTVPLTVTFTDLSIGEVMTRTWGFGDASALLVTGSVTATHVYTAAGVYTVTLTALSPYDSDTLTRTNYITATLGW